MNPSGHTHRTWIKIQELSHPVQEFDASPATWQDKYTMRADINTNAGREAIVGQKTGGLISHIVTLRWQPGVTPEQRVVIDDETIDEASKQKLNIESVRDVDNTKRHLELKCTEAL